MREERQKNKITIFFKQIKLYKIKKQRVLYYQKDRITYREIFSPKDLNTIRDRNSSRKTAISQGPMTPRKHKRHKVMNTIPSRRVLYRL
jgi:hypothetical protein